MDSVKKNDNTAEYCLPSGLPSKKNVNDTDYQEGTAKSRQKLKDLLLSVDNKTDNDNNSIQKDTSVTNKETNSSILCNNIFNEYVNVNRDRAVSDPLDLYTTSANGSVNSSENGRYFSSTDSKFKHNGAYSLSKHGSINSGLDSCIDSKLQRNNVSSILVDSDRSTRTPLLIEKVLTTDEDRLHTSGLYEDANDFVFQDSAYDSAITTRFETEDEWEMAINAETTNSSHPHPVSICSSSKPSNRTLFIKQIGTSDILRQQITQVVGESQITVLSLEESFDVNAKTETYSLVWMHLLSPLSKRALEIMSLIKSSSKSNILPIVVTDKIIKEELSIQVDLFVEPLSKETVERLCSNVKESISRNISSLPPKPPLSVRQFTSTPESTISSASGRTSVGSHSPPRWCRVEHATKEKQRRERIKDSCDQLRVLLPYVKGRKTDMASILEMTVDYLKIVNSALSQDFHSQVIDIMSNGSPPVDDDCFSMNMAYKKNLRKEQESLEATSSAKSFRAVLTKTETNASKTSKEMNLNLNNRMVTRSVARSLTSLEDESHTPNQERLNKARINAYGNVNNRIIVTKRDCSASKVGSSNPKKPHMTLASQDKQLRTFEASTTALVKDYKTENMMEDQPTPNHLYHNLQFPHMFTEGDISANRMFSSGHVASNDGFAYISHSQINLQSTHNSSDRNDVNNYGNVYFDGPYLPYSYSNVQDSNNNNGNYYGTEYVNPNAVLPVTSYTPRVSAFASGRKFERASTTSNSELLQQNDAADVYNNNTVS